VKARAIQLSAVSVQLSAMRFWRIIRRFQMTFPAFLLIEQIKGLRNPLVLLCEILQNNLAKEDLSDLIFVFLVDCAKGNKGNLGKYSLFMG
jgi:hypothetical protein